MRVLIVDDAPDICWVHEKLLRMMGHDALSVVDSRNALSEAKRFHPDVIVLDICMPYADGCDVAEELRADPETQHIRLVALTAMTGEECERRSSEAGFDDHFGKPLPMEQWPEVLTGRVEPGVAPVF